MTTILIKKKDTAGAPAPGDLTNAAGGTEIAVNTATKRIYTKDSGGNVVELGTNSTASTVVDLTVTNSTTLSYGTANQVQYLNGSKLLVGSANMTFNGTTLVVNDLTDSSLTAGRVVYAGTAGNLVDSANMTFNGTTFGATGLNITGNTTLGDAAGDTVTINGTITSNLIFTDNTYDIGVSGATRPRNLYLSGWAQVSGNYSTAQTSAGILDFYSGGARVVSFGANTTTAGRVSLVGLSSNSSVVNQYLDTDVNGNVIIGEAAPANIGRRLSVVGSYAGTDGARIFDNYVGVFSNTNRTNNNFTAIGLAGRTSINAEISLANFAAYVPNWTDGSVTSTLYLQRAVSSSLVTSMLINDAGFGLGGVTPTSYTNYFNLALSGGNSAGSILQFQTSSGTDGSHIRANRSGGTLTSLDIENRQSAPINFQIQSTTWLKLLESGSTLGGGLTSVPYTGNATYPFTPSFGYANRDMYCGQNIALQYGQSIFWNCYYSPISTSVYSFQSGYSANIGFDETTGEVKIRNTQSSVSAGASVATSTQTFGIAYNKSLALQGATIQTGTGITFPASQNASSNANTLDDYEEGTFSPTIDGWNGTYLTQFGVYTKVGNLVYCFGSVTTNGGTGTFTGTHPGIATLPFNGGVTGSTAKGMWFVVSGTTGLTADETASGPLDGPGNGTAAAFPNWVVTGGNVTNWLNTKLSAAGNVQYRFFITYTSA
jgi:hypothetical protein